MATPNQSSKSTETVNSLPNKPSHALSTNQVGKSLEQLSSYGGFSFLESFIENIQNVNPERKARKKIFLTDPEKKLERQMLKEKLKLWTEILTSSASQSEMLEKSSLRAIATQETLNKNQLIALNTTRELETAYRTMSLFYKNTESDKVKNVTIINVSLDQLRDLDNTRFIDHIATELKQNYDRLDLRRNYSLLIIPGYLGSNKVIEKWAKIAHNNKVMLITDFADLDTPDDVVDLFAESNLTGGDLYRCNVIMGCNWLVGRGKVAEVGEEENLYIPPSAGLAGKIYYTLMSQVTAGKKFGGINEVDGVKFSLKKSEISELERMGLVPMVNEYSRVMAFSAKTLFNGDNIGLQTYSVVRVFDYITKVLFDFLNRRAFENWNARLEGDLRRQIANYLDSIKGPDRLIEKFRIMRLEQDPKVKDRIYLDIHLTPYFPAKSFIIKLDGHRGDDPDTAEWNTEYSVDKSAKK